MDNEVQVLDMAQSVLEKYFPELEGQIDFSIEKGEGDSVAGRARFGIQEVIVTYGDGRILEPKYRWALVPLISHELAHLINPVDPDSVMRQRLPASLMGLWEVLVKECSIEREGA